MGRPKYPIPRFPGEYIGSLWAPSVVICPRCRELCEVLLSPRTKTAQAVRCTVCNWHQSNQKTGKFIPESRTI